MILLVSIWKLHCCQVIIKIWSAEWLCIMIVIYDGVVDKEHGRTLAEGWQADAAKKNAFYKAVYGWLDVVGYYGNSWHQRPMCSGWLLADWYCQIVVSAVLLVWVVTWYESVLMMWKTLLSLLIVSLISFVSGHIIGSAVWLRGNALVLINIVALHQNQLVPRWVTICGCVNHLSM